MTHEGIIDETHLDYLEARALIISHGVEPGPEEHTSDQLAQEIGNRKWSWVLGDEVSIRKQHDSPTLVSDGTFRGATPVVALSLALAWAIKIDKIRRDGVPLIPREPR